jgi:hypothetical protein
MRKSILTLLSMALVLLTLTGCDEIFGISPPDETPEPMPPEIVDEYPVMIEFEDTTDVNHYIFPHASIVTARWMPDALCDLDARVACDPDRPMGTIELDLINDGDTDLTRIIGKAFVYDRDDNLITRLTWQRDAFKEKAGEVNVWQQRETVTVELKMQDLCIDTTRDACDAANYTPRNVSRVFIDLEIVGVSPI